MDQARYLQAREPLYGFHDETRSRSSGNFKHDCLGILRPDPTSEISALAGAKPEGNHFFRRRGEAREFARPGDEGGGRWVLCQFLSEVVVGWKDDLLPIVVVERLVAFGGCL